MHRLLGDALPPAPVALADIDRFRGLANADPRLDPPAIDGVESWTSVQILDSDGFSPAFEVEVVTPAGAGPFPVLVWLHGGAWCLGNAAAARGVVGRLASSGFVVVNVDYSLAPEHPFPRAVNDTLAVLSWVALHVVEHRGDPARTAVGGTSAGANLVTSACLAAAGERHPDLRVPQKLVHVRALLLLYGVFDFALLNGDERENTGYVEVMYNRAYLGERFRSLQSHPLVSPARSERLGELPPTMVSVGSLDHLLPQSLTLVEALARNEVSVTCRVAAGLDHSFDAFDDPAANDEIEHLAAWLAGVLADRI